MDYHTEQLRKKDYLEQVRSRDENIHPKMITLKLTAIIDKLRVGVDDIIDTSSPEYKEMFKTAYKCFNPYNVIEEEIHKELENLVRDNKHIIHEQLRKLSDNFNHEINDFVWNGINKIITPILNETISNIIKEEYETTIREEVKTFLENKVPIWFYKDCHLQWFLHQMRCNFKNEQPAEGK